MSPNHAHPSPYADRVPRRLRERTTPHLDAADQPAPRRATTRRCALPRRPLPPNGTRAAKLTVTDVRRLWPEVLEEVKGKRRFTWILLSQNAQVAELRNDTLLLAMANAGARDSFGRGGSEDVLREAIVVVLGADFKIETMVDPGRRSARPPPRVRPPQRSRRPPSRPGRTIAMPRPAATTAIWTMRPESPSELLARHLGAEFIAEGEQRRRSATVGG